jgi:GNAT superfamily N-acetyltransferase
MQLNEVCSEDLLRIFKAKAGERASVDRQYTAFLDDEPVGILGIDTQKDQKANIGWLSYLHVIPNHRNKTFATQLLGLAISDFRKLKRDILRVELPSGTLGINFMSKFGFDVLDVNDQLCLMEKNIRNW